jgi:hypothetical protein
LTLALPPSAMLASRSNTGSSELVVHAACCRPCCTFSLDRPILSALAVPKRAHA